jgi:hypothetical protein
MGARKSHRKPSSSAQWKNQRLRALGRLPKGAKHFGVESAHHKTVAATRRQLGFGSPIVAFLDIRAHSLCSNSLARRRRHWASAATRTYWLSGPMATGKVDQNARWRSDLQCPPPAPTTRTGTRPRSGDARTRGASRQTYRSRTRRCGTSGRRGWRTARRSGSWRGVCRARGAPNQPPPLETRRTRSLVRSDRD